MTSAGGTEIGRVSVKVVPNTAGFRKDAQQELRQRTSGLKVNLGVKIDEDELRREIQNLRVKLATRRPFALPTKLKFIDIRTQLTQLQTRLRSNPLVVPAYVNLHKPSIAPGRGGFGVKGGITNLIRVFQRLEVNAKSALATTSSKLKKVAAVAGIAVGVVGKLVGTLARAVPSVVIIVGALTAAAGVIGGIQAAVGAVAGILAGLPFLISGVASAFAAVKLAMEGVKDAASVLSDEVENLKTHLSQVARNVLTPMFKQLQGVFPTLKQGLSEILKAIGQVGQKLAQVLTTGNALQNFKTMFSSIAGVISGLKDEFAGLVTQVSKLLSQSDLWNILGGVIADVTKQVSKFFKEIRTSQLAKSTFKGLRNIINSLVGLFFEWAKAGMQFLSAAAPGISAFLDGLKQFFSKFNWRQLGAVFGSLFGQIGKSLANMSPKTIKSLERVFFNLVITLAKVYNFLVKLGKYFDIIPQKAKNLKISIQKLKRTFRQTAGVLKYSQKRVLELANSYTHLTDKARRALQKFGRMNVNMTARVLKALREMKSKGKVLLTDLAQLFAYKGSQAYKNFIRDFRKIAPSMVNEKGEVRGAAVAVTQAAIKAMSNVPAEQIGSATTGKYAEGLRQAMGVVLRSSREVAQAAEGNLRAADASGSGFSLISGFAAGIRSAVNLATSAVSWVVNQVQSWLPGSPAEVGPFSGRGWTPYRGRALVEGFARGIRQSSDVAVSATEDMVRGVDQAFESITAPDGGLHATIEHELTGSIDEAVFNGVMAAFDGSRLRIDPSGVAELVNKQNAKSSRR